MRRVAAGGHDDNAAERHQHARNLEQGCCPIKVLESMAAGVLIVASDLFRSR